MSPILVKEADRYEINVTIEQLNSTQLNSDESVSGPVEKPGRQTKLHFWRILEIDRLLQDGRHLSAAEIASRIEDGSYSPRTIQRDIEFMRDTLNAPVRSDGSGYWYGEPNFFIKSIPLTEGEAFAVAVLNPPARAVPQHPAGRAAALRVPENHQLPA